LPLLAQVVNAGLVGGQGLTETFSTVGRAVVGQDQLDLIAGLPPYRFNGLL